MIDWEEFVSSTNKADLKMSQLSAKSVKISLKTWLPRGERSNLHDVLESLGGILGGEVNDKVKKCIRRHFSATDAKALFGMMDSIEQLYTKPKVGNRRKSARLNK